MVCVRVFYLERYAGLRIKFSVLCTFILKYFKWYGVLYNNLYKKDYVIVVSLSLCLTTTA